MCNGTILLWIELQHVKFRRVHLLQLYQKPCFSFTPLKNQKGTSPAEEEGGFWENNVNIDSSSSFSR